MAEAHANTWFGLRAAAGSSDRLIADGLLSKMMWFGVAAVLIFSIQIALLATLETRDGAERLQRATGAISPAAALAVASGQSPELEKPSRVWSTCMRCQALP